MTYIDRLLSELSKITLGLEYDIPNYVANKITDSMDVIKELQAELEQYRQAEQEYRLVIFDKKILPMIWGDVDKNTILCPNCKRDLMGGYPDNSLEYIPMWQCRYCGQPINTCEALEYEEAEAALAKEGEQ